MLVGNFVAGARVSLNRSDTVRNQSEPTRVNVSANGCSIAVTVVNGALPPLLLLHGNSCSSRVWARQFEFLRESRRAVVAVDLPGHGASANSPTPDSSYSFPGYAAVIGNVLDVLGCAQVDVVGWSLGGHIALEMLASHAAIRSVLVSGTPPAKPSGDVVEHVFHTSESLAFASRDKLTAAEATRYAAAMFGGPEWVTPGLVDDILRTDGMARQCMFANVLRGLGSDQRLTIETTSKPVCVVHGELDPFVRLDYLRSMDCGPLWGRQIHIIRGAGHAPHWQTAGAFNALLARFLRLQPDEAQVAREKAELQRAIVFA